MLKIQEIITDLWLPAAGHWQDMITLKTEKMFAEDPYSKPAGLMIDFTGFTVDFAGKSGSDTALS